MAAWTEAARQAAYMARLSSPRSASTARPSSPVHRRGLAGAADHHGTSKVNFWEDPLHPSKWKKEQFVIVSLAGLGGIYAGYNFYTKEQDKKAERVEPPPRS